MKKTAKLSIFLRVAGGMAVLLAFLCPASAQSWRYHSTARFVIAYSPEEKNLALHVLGKLQSYQAELSQRLGFSPERAIQVYLCPTQSSFDRLTGGAVPHWGAAAANPAQWRIFLKSPGASPGAELEPFTIEHELVHLTLAELSWPQRLPRWFDEGAAILLSQETRHANPTVISRAMATGSLVSFDEIESLLSFPDARAGLAYTESYHAVNFLVKRFGTEAIKKFAQALAHEPDGRQAFHAAFGEDLWDFEVEYFDYLREQFRWYFLLDESVLWGGAILVLVIAAYLVTRWRTKNKVAEWEKEEPDEESEEWSRDVKDKPPEV
jgi:hypothetical protein